MAILHEDIQFSDDEPFRLLSWQKNTLDLVSHEMSNKTKSVRGVGGRWHSHPELQMTVVTSGRGLDMLAIVWLRLKPVNAC